MRKAWGGGGTIEYLGLRPGHKIAERALLLLLQVEQKPRFDGEIIPKRNKIQALWAGVHAKINLYIFEIQAGEGVQKPSILRLTKKQTLLANSFRNPTPSVVCYST